MQYRRSIFLINKPFQLRYSLYVCSWLFALSLIYPLIIYNLFEYFVRYASLDPNGPSIAALHDTRHQVVLLLIFLQLLFLSVTFLISIFTSHRIAGPLYKLRLFFKKAKESGMTEELHFRKGDHFQELAVDYNDMMNALRSRHQTAIAHLEKGDTQKALAALRT
jgi:sensor histidine kinase YesM